jgi:hypothetical protein
MFGVAIVALNLAMIKALLSELGEHLLFDALPTVNIMVYVGIMGFLRRRARAFAVGFVVVAILSLLAFQAWMELEPWVFLRTVCPPFEAIDRRIEAIWPNARVEIMYILLIIAFAIPHTLLGVAGGYLSAKGWALIARRKAFE